MYAALWDKQTETIEDEIREPKTKLTDGDITCVQDIEIKRESVHTEGWQGAL